MTSFTRFQLQRVIAQFSIVYLPRQLGKDHTVASEWDSQRICSSCSSSGNIAPTAWLSLEMSAATDYIRHSSAPSYTNYEQQQTLPCYYGRRTLWTIMFVSHGH